MARSDGLQVALVGSHIPPAVPKPAVGPGLYVLFTFVLPMAPAIGPFSPLLLSTIMTAFGGKNIIEVTRSNVPASSKSVPPGFEAKTEPKTEPKTDDDAKKD